MASKDKITADQKFNETLKRMLKTPPKKHDDEKAQESHEKKEKSVD